MLPIVKAFLISSAAAAMTFCAYSIPKYYQMVSYQRGGRELSVPPNAAFLIGGGIALIAFVVVFAIIALSWAWSRQRGS